MYLHLFNPLASLQGFQLDCRPEVFQLVGFRPEEYQLAVYLQVACLLEVFQLAVYLQVVYQQQVGLTRRLQQFDGHDGQLPSAYRLLKPLGLL